VTGRRLKDLKLQCKAVEPTEAQFRYHWTMSCIQPGLFLLRSHVCCCPRAAGVASQSRPLSSSSSAQHVRKPSSAADSTLDPGSVGNGVYRNRPRRCLQNSAGWVLRTDEMNSRRPSDDPQRMIGHPGQSDNTPRGNPPRAAARCCWRRSRAPGGHGGRCELIIVIAAESSTSYPGLKDAAQYFGPLSEVATRRIQGGNEPYQFLSGTKMLVRGDYAKDRGRRAMHQTTLVMLRRGYAISFTFIGGTEDELKS